ncbi:MAG: DeoR family transcriptional regulator, partial [Erysipelotrichaceae bacterium]|nr:DeoR family transcriptional regulator [Erysipelotrichaceae bacterium]
MMIDFDQNMTGRNNMNTERAASIISLLEKYSYISVQDLAELLHTSTPTARRALSELEKEG